MYLLAGAAPDMTQEDHPELDMFSEWIKERVRRGHVMPARAWPC